MDRRALLTIVTFLALFLATVVAISYINGYRPNFGDSGGVVKETGILAATSSPEGAQVFLNGRLTTATNNTLNLTEAEYVVKIIKDGYIPWEKKVKIKNGIVTETQAHLFPNAPDLRAETTTGTILPTISPDGTKLVYGVASGSAEKRGVWVMDLNDRPLLAQAQSRQISTDLADASFTWSPDSRQIVATINKASFLLNSDRLNPIPQEITSALDTLLESWEKEIDSHRSEILGKLTNNLLKELSKMTIIAWSPDETKILYSANQSAILPPILEKIPPGSSTQLEQRGLKEGSIYVYDIKEDKNFPIVEKLSRIFSKQGEKQDKISVVKPTPSAVSLIENISLAQRSQPLQWFPDSRHLILVEGNNIYILEYDGINKATIYSGPFEDSFVYPWPNGSKLIILTTYNRASGIAPNLYSISLK